MILEHNVRAHSATYISVLGLNLNGSKTDIQYTTTTFTILLITLFEGREHFLHDHNNMVSYDVTFHVSRREENQ